jgi:predicted Ser/Thr protein kinase
MSDPLIGQEIIGQFRIERLIAAGGMSCVYLARQESMGRYAAVKIVGGGSAQNSEWRNRLRREARAASRLVHPNIITLYNFGELSEDTLFLAMEYVEGRPLSRMLDQGPLSVSFAASLAAQCAAALAYAHEMGVMHRDFKPDNVMVGPDFTAKVLDFGLAKLIDEGGEGSTRAGNLLGTPRYMSPEQCRGEVSSVATDQYALGLVVFEMLTGRRAVEAENLFGYLKAHQTGEIPLLAKASDNREVAAFDDVVQRLVQKRPEDRYPSMAHARQALLDRYRALGGTTDEFEILAAKPSTAPGLPYTFADPAVIATKTVVDLSSPALSLDDTLFAAAERERRQAPIELLPLGRVPAEPGLLKLELESRGYSVLPNLDFPQSFERCEASMIGLDVGAWQAQWRAWKARGLDESRVLVCIDASLDSQELVGCCQELANVLIGRFPLDPLIVGAALDRIHRGPQSGIEAVYPAATIEEQMVSDESQKAKSVERLLQVAKERGVRRRVLRALAEVSEEMLLNAIYHAPPQRKAARRAGRLQPQVTGPLEQGPLLRWAFSDDHAGAFVVVSVADHFGTLNACEALSRVTGVEYVPCLAPDHGGVGMGLRIIASASQHMMVSLAPGSSCEVLALVPQKLGKDGDSPKSFCVLQRASRQQDARQLGQNLKAIAELNPVQTQFRLEGAIEEDADLRWVFLRDEAICLDLSSIKRINSMGVRCWLDAFRARHSSASVTFERCSPALVSQLGMIPAMTQGVVVASVMAPYFCESCDNESLELVDCSEVVDRQPPERVCTMCGKRLEFDEMPEQFFAFMLDDEA